LVRGIIGLSMTRPSDLVSSALESERNFIPAAAPPDSRPHAYTCAENREQIIKWCQERERIGIEFPWKFSMTQC
jgi:hypothetical protein